MADGKIYRLITVGLWVGFCAELYMGGLIILAALNDPIGLLSGLSDVLLFQKDPLPALLIWLYPLMLGVQYVVEGEFKWLPWKR